MAGGLLSGLKHIEIAARLCFNATQIAWKDTEMHDKMQTCRRAMGNTGVLPRPYTWIYRASHMHSDAHVDTGTLRWTETNESEPLPGLPHSKAAWIRAKCTTDMIPPIGIHRMGGLTSIGEGRRTREVNRAEHRAQTGPDPNKEKNTITPKELVYFCFSVVHICKSKSG